MLALCVSRKPQAQVGRKNHRLLSRLVTYPGLRIWKRWSWGQG